MRGKLAIAALAGALMTGCTSGPNHIGNPLTLPGRAITNGISELGYKARRKRVKDFVAGNTPQIHADIAAGGGPHITTAMDMTGVEDHKRRALLTELRAQPQLYATADIEPLVVALMVYGK